MKFLFLKKGVDKMRVSSYQQYKLTQSNVGKIQTKMAHEQFQLATGKKYSRPSEAPIEAKQIEVIHQAQKRVEQFQKNINDAKGVLETTETTLGSIYKAMENVNGEMIKASNEVYTPEDLKTIAMVVGTALEQVVAMTNTKHLNRYIFSGEKIETKPFDFDGTTVVYNGNSNAMNMEVSPYANVPVNEGGDAFLEGIINGLVKIRDQIATGDRVGLTASLTSHSSNMDKVTNKIAEIGVRIDSLNTSHEAFIEQILNLEQRRSSVEDVDFTELMVDFSISQRTYSASLKASSMMFQTSILDYI